MIKNANFLTVFEYWVTKAARISDWIGRSILVVCIFLVVSNVIGNLLGKPIPGTYEYVGVLTCVTISLCLAQCQVNKGHIRISLLIDRLPSKVQLVLGIVGSILCAVLFGLVLYASYQSGMSLWQEQRYIGTTPLLLSPVVFIVGFGCLLISLVLLVDALNFTTKLVKR